MPPCSIDNLRREVRSLYAPSTHAAKTWYIARQALDELEAIGVTSTTDIKTTLLCDWLQKHQDRSAMTNKKLLSQMRAIFGYCVHEGYMEKSPFGFRGLKQYIRAPRPKAKRHHSAEDINRLLEMIKSESVLGWDQHRLSALIWTYAFTGLRKLEALRLKVEDVDLENGVIQVVARTRLKTVESEAPVPMPDALISVLKTWVPETKSEWLFPHKKLTGPWTEGRVGHKPLDQIKIAGERAGIKNLTILSFRHTYATMAEAWGLTPLLLMRILRHTSVHTQQAYRHADIANLRRAVKDADFRKLGEGPGDGQKALGA